LEWCNIEEVLAQQSPHEPSHSRTFLQQSLFQNIHHFFTRTLETHLEKYPLLKGLTCHTTSLRSTHPVLQVQFTHPVHLQDTLYFALETCLTLLQKPLKIEGCPVVLRGGADLILAQPNQDDPFLTLHERRAAPPAGLCVSHTLVTLMGVTTHQFHLEEVPTEVLMRVLDTSDIPLAHSTGIAPVWYVSFPQSVSSPTATPEAEVQHPPVTIEGLWEDTSDTPNTRLTEQPTRANTSPAAQQETPWELEAPQAHETPLTTINTVKEVPSTVPSPVTALHSDSLPPPHTETTTALFDAVTTSDPLPLSTEAEETFFPTVAPPPVWHPSERASSEASLRPQEAIPNDSHTFASDFSFTSSPWVEAFQNWLSAYTPSPHEQRQAQQSPQANAVMPWGWYQKRVLQSKQAPAMAYSGSDIPHTTVSQHTQNVLLRESLSLAELAQWLEESWLKAIVQKTPVSHHKLVLSGVKGSGKTQLLQGLKTVVEQWGAYDTHKSQLQWLHVQGRVRTFAPHTQHPTRCPIPYSFLQEWLYQWLGLPVDSVPFEMLTQRVDAVMQHLFASSSTGGESSALAQRVREYLERCLMIQNPEPVSELIQTWHDEQPEKLTGLMPTDTVQSIWFKCLIELIPLLRRQGPILWVLDDAHLMDEASLNVFEHVMQHTQDDAGVYWCVVLESESVQTNLPSAWHTVIQKQGYHRWHHLHLRKPTALELKWLFQQGPFALRVAPPDTVFQMLVALLPQEGVYFWLEEVFRYLQDFQHLKPEGSLDKTSSEDPAFSENPVLQTTQQLPLYPAGDFTWDRLPQILPLTKLDTSNATEQARHCISDHLLLERMEYLNVTQQELLRWLAMAGGVMSMPALSQLMQLDEAKLQTVLEELWSLGWVVPDMSGNVMFRHALQHDFVYDHIPPTVMKQAHEVMLNYFRFALKHHHVCDYALLLEQASLSQSWDNICHAFVGLSVRFTSQLEAPLVLLPLMRLFMKTLQQSAWQADRQSFFTWYGDIQWLYVHILAPMFPQEALAALEKLHAQCQHSMSFEDTNATQNVLSSHYESATTEEEAYPTLGFTFQELHTFHVQLRVVLGQVFQAASLLEQHEPDGQGSLALHQWEHLPLMSEKVGYYLEAGYVGTAASMIHIQMFPLLLQWREVAMSHEEHQAIEALQTFLRWKQAWCYTHLEGATTLEQGLQKLPPLTEQIYQLYQMIESQAPYTWIGSGALHYQWVCMSLLLGETERVPLVLRLLKQKLSQNPQETLWVYEAMAQLAFIQYQGQQLLWQLGVLEQAESSLTKALTHWEERMASHVSYLWQQVLPLRHSPLEVSVFYESVSLMLSSWLDWLEIHQYITHKQGVPSQTSSQHLDISLQVLAYLEQLRKESQSLGLVGWWSHWETLYLRIKILGMQTHWEHPHFSMDAGSWQTWLLAFQKLDRLLAREDIAHHNQRLTLQLMQVEAMFLQNQWLEGGKLLESLWKGIKETEAQTTHRSIMGWRSIKASRLITQLYQHLVDTASTLPQKNHYQQKLARLTQNYRERVATFVSS
jgi:hypothetical protein